jgi:hypothetical protein
MTKTNFAKIVSGAALLLLASMLPGLAAMQGENLLVPPLQGWQEAYKASGNGKNMVEYVPNGQTVDSWNEMTTIEVFLRAGGYDPDKLEQKVADGFRLNCEALHVEDLGGGTTNGLKAKRWLTYCSKVKGLGVGEITYFQAISGKANFYLIQRIWRGAPFDLTHPPVTPAKLKEWEQYMNGLAVCDSADPTRPCP